MTISTAEFDFVRTLVRRESAIVLEPGKEYLVEARLMPLARAKGLADVSFFLAAMRRENNRAEQDRVVDALTTNETSFFRDGGPFVALENEILPSVMASRTDDRVLRVWCAACSSGQEPYSIAMALGDRVKTAGWRLEITGTDLSDDMLRRSREGRYSQLEVNRGLPATHLVRHFSRAGTDWQVSEELRRTVRFTKLNLATPFPLTAKYDVVFLRNVLIYFDTATKRDILQRTQRIMRPSSYLLLGAAETTLGVDDSWARDVIGRAVVYRPRPHPASGR